jgi:PAS domain S-box-containing protein
VIFLSDEPTYEDLKKRILELEHVELVRKQTEEELAQIFSMSLDMVCIADINSATFLKVNSSFTEILGYSENELLGIPFLDLVHPDDINSTKNVLEQKLQLGIKVYNFENRYRCKDKSYRWLSWVSHPNPEKSITYAVARDITEWKKNDEALKRSKALLDATGCMARVGGWELNVKTMEVTWTEEVYRIHEIPPDKKLHIQEAINFFHPKDRPKLEQAIQRSLDYGEPYDMELRFITAKGNHLWAHTICEPEVTDGKTTRLKGAFQDITERKNVEELLKHNTQRYEKAQRIGRVGNWEYDLKTRKFWGSEVAKSIYGFDSQKEFFTAEEVQNCIPDRERVQQALVNLIEKDLPYNLEFEIQPLAGPEKKYIRSIAEVVADESGIPVKVDGAILDITGLKLVDKKLRKSEEKYRQLFHSIKDSILVADTNRNIIDCNQTFRECFGYSKEEIIGRQTACLYESKEEFLRMGNRLKEHFEHDEKNFIYNINYKKKSGEIFPGETNAFFLENDKSETVGFIGIIRDITHLKNAEESLQKANEELESKAFELEDTNTALKVLLQKRDQDNLELQENLYSNYVLMIEPFINKLKNKASNKDQHNLIDIIETNLKEIVNPFIKKISNPMMSLTQSEIQIATMIKQGFTNKEIAKTLNCSKRTIDTHRENIRKKLNLTHQKINLKTFLLNF